MKLEEIERQLKAKLERARELAAACSVDEPVDKTQEELLTELEVEAAPLRTWNCRTSTPPSTTATNTGKPTCRTKSTAHSSARSPNASPCSTTSSSRSKYPHRHAESPGRTLPPQPAQEPQEEQAAGGRNREELHVSLRQVSPHLRLGCQSESAHQTQAQWRQQDRPRKTSSNSSPIQEKICMAEENRLPQPPMTLNLPPGYLRVPPSPPRNTANSTSRKISPRPSSKTWRTTP